MSRASDRGRVSCSLKGSVEAGSWQTAVLTYTAGFAGVDDTGSLKIVMRYATDSGTPQFDDPSAPNYTTAVASNGARLLLRYDTKDNTRPWGKTILIKVLQGYLREGEKIKVTLGDTGGGSPGWRMQTFLEDTLELRVLVDRYATYVYEQLPKSPTFRVVAGPPVRMVAVAPTLLTPGKKFTVRTRLEDRWGNPVGRPKKHRQPGISEAGVHRITIADEATGLSAETNPILVRNEEPHGRYWADLHGQTEETIGTNTIDDYFRFARDIAYLDACGHQGNDFQITDTFWQKIQQTTADFYAPGKFVTFPGWEWSGNTGLGGDRNVLYREEGGLITRSSRALVSGEEAADPCSDTVEDLFDNLEATGRDVMLIAHVGGRYADLERHREGLEPAVEVHSAWGTFEWMLDDAFSRGYRMAIVANSDGHKGRPGASWPGASTFGSYGGLTCILADRLDRDSVWDAYQNRRVYATTGARIALDVTGHFGSDGDGKVIPMGSVIESSQSETLSLRVSVAGTAPIERIEFRNAMNVLKTFRTYSSADLTGRVKVLWQGATVRGRGRQVNWDGGLKLTGNRINTFQPINFLNPEKACTQTGPRELRWESLTTGGVAGVILDLDRPSAGTLEVETSQRSFQAKIGGLGVRGRSYDLGGVGKRISTYRLPAASGPREMEFEFTPRPRDLHAGDNPLYICVVQEDGHMAWSSPIYLVR